jgi:hypothetical protein
MTDNLFLINYKNKEKSSTLFSFDCNEVTERNRNLMCQHSLNVLLNSYIERIQNWRMELLKEVSCLIYCQKCSDSSSHCKHWNSQRKQYWISSFRTVLQFKITAYTKHILNVYVGFFINYLITDVSCSEERVSCFSNSKLRLYYIKNQQDATLAVLFISHCKIRCFGRFLRPSSGVLETVVAATGACHGSWWYISSKDVQDRLNGNRPWTSLLDIYHPHPWHAPMAATTVFSTPDDGHRKRPKHVEWSCSD